jgi:putative DNA primase/helicase
MSRGHHEDIDELRAELKDRAADLTMLLLGHPNRSMSSKRQLRFGRKGSLSVEISGAKAGLWYDHESGEGGDLFELIGRERGGGFADALKFARSFVGSTAISTPRPKLKVVGGRDHERDAHSSTARLAARIWNESGDPRGTVVETYLRSRGLEFPDGIDGEVIRFHRPFRCAGSTAAGMVCLVDTCQPQSPRFYTVWTQS